MVHRELLDRCRRGEPGAFEELVERTQRQVYTLAYRLTGDRHEAEDVAQEAYLRAFRSMGGFREDARFETWLYRIVTNAAMTHLRRKGRFGVLMTEEREQRAPEPEIRPVDEVIERDELRRALAELPPETRAIVVLKDVYGLSVQEIAEEAGLTEGAVKLRLHRARKRLKEMLYGAHPGHEEIRERLPEYVGE
ncbi:MAG TPA: sigma-70 family RNA polymerase sigma factor [Actinomycetota bacterium]|jgi:RNA polymerase sigma-70 factor (ECF subfamily)|nr:sigma-70 family RNA polymerase sigma factor [Actinomycetota bacterium]